MSLIHHVLGFQTMFCALIPFNMPLVFGSAMCWLEISTPFIAFRWMMFFHGITGGDLRQTINTIICAIVFIAFRSVFQLIAIYCVLDWLSFTFFQETGRPFWYLPLMTEFFLAVVINVVFNAYWSYLIIYQIVRALSRNNKDQTFADGITNKEEKKQRVKNPKHVELAEVPEYVPKDNNA